MEVAHNLWTWTRGGNSNVYGGNSMVAPNIWSQLKMFGGSAKSMDMDTWR